jgi:hypothetical protein
MFTVCDSDLSVSIGEVCRSGDPDTARVQEQQGSAIRQLDRCEAPFRLSFMEGSDHPRCDPRDHRNTRLRSLADGLPVKAGQEPAFTPASVHAPGSI